MRCGICKSDSPTFEPRGWRWKEGDVVSALPVRDAGNLVTHKRQQHPEEYAKSAQARKDTKAAHEAADQDYHQRRNAAGLAAGRTVVFRWPYGDLPLEVTTTSGIDGYNRLSDYRYPEPDAFGEYRYLQQAITDLQERAALTLRRAFERGAPVPQADVDKVRAAMDAVPVEPS